MIGYAQAYLRLCLKATIGRQQHERRWLERILRRELDAAMVNTAFEFTVARSPDSELPLKDVLLEGEAHEVVGGVGLHLLDLLQDPLHRRVLPVVLVLRHVRSPLPPPPPPPLSSSASFRWATTGELRRTP